MNARAAAMRLQSARCSLKFPTNPPLPLDISLAWMCSSAAYKTLVTCGALPAGSRPKRYSNLQKRKYDAVRDGGKKVRSAAYGRLMRQFVSLGEGAKAILRVSVTCNCVRLHVTHSL